jgi:PBP1b-binding outer membrane lipoprotein LpoB
MKRNILGLILALVVSGCAGSSGTPVPPEEEASSKSADPAPEKPGIDLAVDPKVEPVPEAKPVPVPIAVEGASVSKPTESVETAVTTTTTITATAQKSAGAPKANPVVEKEAIPQEEKPASKPEPEPEPKSQKMVTAREILHHGVAGSALDSHGLCSGD